VTPALIRILALGYRVGQNLAVHRRFFGKGSVGPDDILHDEVRLDRDVIVASPCRSDKKFVRVKTVGWIVFLVKDDRHRDRLRRADQVIE
jgi:hypothetical protein